VSDAVSVVFLCSGNATRSVIAGLVLSLRRPELDIVTAGTMVIEGLPISWRTRAALDDVGLAWPRHASKQVSPQHLTSADLIVALAPEHVEWVRREHPDAADRTGTLIRLANQLAEPCLPLAERIAGLGLAAVELEPWEEVVDPGGGEVDQFVACAREIVPLVDRLAELL
jgi:protein-tyrosine-phosphatase